MRFFSPQGGSGYERSCACTGQSRLGRCGADGVVPNNRPREAKAMTVYLIADVKVTDDKWVPAYAASVHDLVKGGVAIAVTQALGAEANAADATRKIALEEHFTTAELAKSYVARPTRSDTLFADIERRLADFDQPRLETMDKAGIDLAVLSVTTPGVQAEKDTNTAIKLAREANDLLAREVQKRPQRYAGFAHLPTQHGGAAAAELERAVKDLRFKGAFINGQTNGKYLDANMYLPFWERVQDLDVPIYLHPGELADHPAMFAGRPELNGPGLGLDGGYRRPCAAARVRRHVHAVSETEDHSRPHGRDASIPAVAL
ncbi:MAG: amidohydrolase family protein [Rhodoplanes sp.]